MLTKLILFLLRRKLRVHKYEAFRFDNQKSDAIYYFGDTAVWKLWRGQLEKSHVSINWLLDDDCVVIPYEG